MVSLRGVGVPSWCRSRSVVWFSYWFDNLGLITDRNTYCCCVASSLHLWGNTDVVQADIKTPRFRRHALIVDTKLVDEDLIYGLVENGAPFMLPSCWGQDLAVLFVHDVMLVYSWHAHRGSMPKVPFYYWCHRLNALTADWFYILNGYPEHSTQINLLGLLNARKCPDTELSVELWVDEVIPDAPWVVTEEFLNKHNIDFVAHDSLPYHDASGASNDVYEFVKKLGKFKETKRTEGISTSDIIMRIVKDYNEYVMRNLARGYSRNDLGVSYVKEKRLRVNMGLKTLRDKVKQHQEKVGEKWSTVAKLQEEWVENADRWVVGFLEKFEEGCHSMGTAIKERIQERLKEAQSRDFSLLQYDSDDFDDFEEEDDEVAKDAKYVKE
ncbi:hypothetical protein TRIUR3_26638 [Triticum urartu]|uniref:choline-phosphate cytidylyltransferase n=2 Tax=Triticinae TaxID=1648030 RepID=M7ZPZ7_TRIUA|nr:hypothetical protein TRIUR3_26638 [Triticum urartu]